MGEQTWIRVGSASRPLYIPGGVIMPNPSGGDIYYVNSATGSSANDGLTPTAPKATLAQALALATAGDLILVAAGHAETLTAAVALGTAGVMISGEGAGNKRPTFTVNGTVDGLNITADDVWVDNLLFATPTLVATAQINIAAARAVVRGCGFVQGANSRDAITVTAAGEVPTIEACDAQVTANGPDSFVRFEGVVDKPTIRNNTIIGSDGTNVYDDGVIDFNDTTGAGGTSHACTNPLVYGNTFSGGGVATTVIANGGNVVRAVYGGNTYGASAVDADNTGSGLGTLVDGLWGGDGITTFPNAAIPANGVSLAEVIRQLYAALEGTAAGQNGVATWPTAAAYANNVSVAEVLGYIQDAVRQGTGTVLPNNISLYDVLAGAKGIPTAFPTAAIPAADVSMAEVLAQVYAALEGTAVGMNGVATWPAAAAYGNNISIAEVLAYIQDGVRQGTGTVLPNNVSLYDILGGAKGHPAFPNAAVPANDVSMIEVLRDVWASICGTAVGENGVQTFPDAAVPANNVSLAEVTRSVWGGLWGTAAGENGIAAFPAAAIPANDVSLAEVIRQLYAALEGTAADQNGVATWPAAAAYGNNVSIAEVLGYIQDGVRQGTGTVLPNNVSLYDILAGAKGIPTAFPAAAIPAADVSMAEVLAQVYAALEGTAAGMNGVATWPAAAAPGDGVSIAEAIRYIVETQLGTLVNTGGTATVGGIVGDLANDSLVARLNDIGSNVDGTTTDTIQGKLGTDTELADRSLFDLLVGDGPAAFPNGAAPANDVSLAEVLRDVWDVVRNGTGGAEPATNRSVMDYLGVTPAFFVPGLGYRVQRAAADIFNGLQVALFTVAGGRVLLTSLSAEVSVAAIDGGASATKFRTNPTVGTDMDLCATLDINGNEVGTLYGITGVVTDAMTGGSGGGSMTMGRPVIVAEGTIDISSAADVGTGGALGAAELWYLPLDTGAAVTAV